MKLENFVPGFLRDRMIPHAKEVPNNHRALLEKMFAHANENPAIEVGGIFLTDQRQNIHQIARINGEKHKVPIRLPSAQELRQYTNWDTFVCYHSHPYLQVLAHMDPGPSPEDQSIWYRWVDVLRSSENDYSSLEIASLYSYVIRAADGRFSAKKD